MVNLEGLQEESVHIQHAISEADIITISAGANDILQKVDINRETGEIDMDLTELMAGLEEVNSNLEKIHSEIYALNPDVQIYVMGYYNPFPYLPSEVQPQLNILTDQLNSAIESSLSDFSADYVETKDTIADNFQMYLPNPNNIHLSDAGYQKLAALFWNKLINYQWIIKPAFTDVKKKTGHNYM